VHGPLDALLSLLAQHPCDPQRIEAIEVETYGGALRIANRPRPEGFTDIQFSIPYCLGLVAVDGPEALLPLTEAAVGRTDVVAVAEKVTLRLDPELDARFPAETLSRVKIRIDGRTFISPVTAPSGEADAPPSWPALEDKLRKASRNVAAPGQQDMLLDALRRLRDGDHAPLQEAFRTLRLGQA
jgi:2-methylcitrate dehydratase PrpD